MSKKNWFYIIFFVVLVAIFYLTLTSLVPGFGKKRLPAVSYVRPFSFIDQDGRTVTEKNLAGKVYVAEYFFTTCKGICPRMNENMRTVYEEFKDDPDFLVVSHTSDPDVDVPAVLRNYADYSLLDTKKWIFLTGRKDSLYTTARISYTIDDPKNNLKSIDDDFLHTQFWALVDRSGDVKKIYDSLKEEEVAQLRKDIRKLLKD